MKKTTSRKTPKDYPKINFRITPAEEKRINRLIELLQKTNPFLTNVHVYKELMSLTDRGLITPAMRNQLAGTSRRHDMVEPVEDGNGVELEIEEKKKA